MHRWCSFTFNCCRLQSEDASFCLNACCPPLSGDEGRNLSVCYQCGRGHLPQLLALDAVHTCLQPLLTPSCRHTWLPSAVSLQYIHLSTPTTPRWIIVAMCMHQSQTGKPIQRCNLFFHWFLCAENLDQQQLQFVLPAFFSYQALTCCQYPALRSHSCSQTLSAELFPDKQTSGIFDALPKELTQLWLGWWLSIIHPVMPPPD